MRSPSLEDVLQMVREVDKDNSGEIDFEEFCEIMAKQMQASDPEEEMRWAFSLFDRQKTGYITAEQLADTFLAELGDSIAVEEAREMLAAADFDQDGKVTLADFLKLVGQ